MVRFHCALALSLAACQPLFSKIPAVKAPNAAIGRAPPNLTFQTVSPIAARAGQTQTVVFTSDRPLTSCSISLAGVNGTCTASGTTCTCTITVTAATPDGVNQMTLAGTASTGANAITAPTNIDQLPPVITISDLSIIRHSVGTADAVTIQTGGIVDPPPPYAGQGVVEIDFWPDNKTTAPLFKVTDPSLSQALVVSLTGTETSSPDSIWVSATDAVGNVSARAEIQAGNVTQPPTVTGSSVSLTHAPVNSLESVSAASGAVQAGCAPATYQLFADGTTLTPLLSGELNPDGSLTATTIANTTTQEYADLFIVATDKCGNQSARTDILGGKDAGPTGTGAGVTIIRNASGPDSVNVASGDFGDAAGCVFVSASVSLTATGLPLASANTNPDGSLASPINIGTASSSYPTVYVTETTKCGTSATVQAGNGNDPGPSVANASHIIINRNPRTTPDSVSVTSGAFTDPVNCAFVSANIASTSGGAALYSTATLADGSFASPVSLGVNPLISLPTVWVTEFTKCQTQVQGQAGVGNDAGPTGDGTKISMTRNDLSTPDTVTAAAGAFSDACAFVTASISAQASGSPVIASPVPAQNGSFAATAVGTATSAPVVVYVSETTKCGTQLLVEQAAGAGVVTTGPSINTTGGCNTTPWVGVARTAWNSQDTLQVNNASCLVLAAPHCTPWQVAVTDAGGTQTWTAQTNGSFSPFNFGTPTLSYPTASVVVTDKCGLSSASAAAGGADTTAPTIDPTKMTFHINAPGPATQNMQISGTANGVVDSGGVNPSLALSETSGPTPFNPVNLSADGSIALQSVTLPPSGSPTNPTFRFTHLYVVAADKSGNTSTATYVKNVADTMTPQGRAPYVDFSSSATPSSPVSLRPFVFASGGAVPTAAFPDTSLDRLLAASFEVDPATANMAGQASSTTPIQIIGSSLATYTPAAPTWTSSAASASDSQILVDLPAITSAPPVVEHLLTLFGGTANAGPPAWASGAVLPTPRKEAASAYFAEKNMLVAFGGTALGGGALLGDTIIDTGTGPVSNTLVPSPSARTGAAMAYDAGRSRLVLYGGNTGAGVSNETWEFDGAAWKNVTPGSNPQPALAWHAMAPSGVASSTPGVLLFGGNSSSPPSGSDNQDTWLWNGTAWSQNTVTTQPSGRIYPGFVYDWQVNQILLFAGMTNDMTIYFTDAYSTLGADYTALAPVSPPQVANFASAFDPNSNAIVLVGGETGSSPQTPVTSASYLTPALPAVASQDVGMLVRFALEPGVTVQATPAVTVIATGDGDKNIVGSAGVAAYLWNQSRSLAGSAAWDNTWATADSATIVASGTPCTSCTIGPSFPAAYAQYVDANNVVPSTQSNDIWLLLAAQAPTQDSNNGSDTDTGSTAPAADAELDLYYVQLKVTYVLP